MSQTQRILLFFVLPMLTPLIFPLDWLAVFVGGGGTGSVAGVVGILMFLALFGGLGYLLLTGRSRALTLMIFLMGLNAIVRLMMFFPKVTYTDGTLNPMFGITSLISIGLSIYLLLRLDRVDVRKTMVK